MHWLKKVLSEIFALFVDDGSFAIFIVIWLAAAGFTLTHLNIPAFVKGPILFSGLGIILLQSAVRQARSKIGLGRK